MTRARTYLYDCKLCGRWVAVPTATAQRFARRRGACVHCLHDPQWKQRVYINLIALHVDAIVARGKAAPAGERAHLRRLYAKRLQQLAAARAVLAAAGQRAEVEA
jgi:ABC-type cobalamin/Fe3+-siderophores transport system ATPase subunit